MARLPVVDGDTGDWGTILNDFLQVSHNTDGTLQTSVVQQAGAVTAINVKAYGAKGDGSADDTAAIATAINAVANGGQVYFPAGTYNTSTITLPSGVWLVGAGYEATVIKLKANTNSHLVMTANFTSLTGTNTATTGVPFNFGIMNLTLDANKAANATGGYGIAIYGYGYSLQNIIVRNANSWGIWTEWSTSSASPGNDSMEAFVSNFKVHDCNGGGISHQGPHDSQFINGILYNNGTGSSTTATIDMPVDGKANGSTFSDIHIWGGTYNYGFRIASSGILLNGCQCEGGLIAQILLTASLNQIIATKLFDGGVNTSTTKGLVLGANVNNCRIEVKVENCGGGVLDISASGINANDYAIIGSYYGGTSAPSPAVIGSYDSQSTVTMTVLNNGTATSDSKIITPGAIQNQGFTVAQSWGGGIGVNVQPSSNDAFLMRTTADSQSGLVIFPNSSTQSANLIRVQDSSYIDRFTVSMNGVTTVGAKNGLSALTFGGYKSSAGAPTTGTWATGDMVLDSAGAWWICTTAGTPGTWIGG